MEFNTIFALRKDQVKVRSWNQVGTIVAHARKKLFFRYLDHLLADVVEEIV